MKYYATLHGTSYGHDGKLAEWEGSELWGVVLYAKDVLQPGQHLLVWETLRCGGGPIAQYDCSLESTVTQVPVCRCEECIHLGMREARRTRGENNHADTE